MKRTMMWLFTGLFLGRSFAAEPAGPSMEMLLYLAEWATDERGELIDPLDVPDDPRLAPAVRPDVDSVQRDRVEEYSR